MRSNDCQLADWQYVEEQINPSEQWGDTPISNELDSVYS
ncbi:unnamed protein product, partial [Rotaria sp. Silwood1]